MAYFFQVGLETICIFLEEIGEAKAVVNLLITVFLGGLWHGASWNFVVWGLLHGVALVFHKLDGKGV